MSFLTFVLQVLSTILRGKTEQADVHCLAAYQV